MSDEFLILISNVLYFTTKIMSIVWSLTGAEKARACASVMFPWWWRPLDVSMPLCNAIFSDSEI